MSCLEEALVGGLVSGGRVARRTTMLALVASRGSASLGRSVALGGRRFTLAGKLCLQRRDLAVEVGDVLVLGSMAGNSVDGVGLLSQNIGCEGCGLVDSLVVVVDSSAVVVVCRSGVGESRRKGQSECGVSVHDAR